MTESYDSYEIYVSPAGIRVCAAGWDQCFRWEAIKSDIETCRGHDTGPEVIAPGSMKDSPGGKQQ